MKTVKKKAALFSISSLGLGHATRTAPIVRSYLDTHDIHIVSAGKALAFLKKEFTGAGIVFHELKDYPPIERGRGSWRFYRHIVTDSLAVMSVIRKEHAFIEKLARKIQPEFILSDGRYGSYVKGIPSFILSHQISFVMPSGFGFFQKLADRFNYRAFRKFAAVIIPDYEDPDNSLAGDLSHHPILNRLPHHYVGILSLSQARHGATKDIDVLFTISGYLDEHKQTFVGALIEEAKKLPGKKVFVLGDPDAEVHTVLEEHDIEIHSSVSGQQRNDLFSRAKHIVSRSGYTTVMDLVELDIPGFLIPTPGQTEQEYLAQYLAARGHFLVSFAKKIDLGSLRTGARADLPFKAPWKTDESVKKIRKLISDRVSK